MMVRSIQNRARDVRPYGGGAKTCCRRYIPPPCYLTYKDFPHISPFASTLSSNGRYKFRPRAQQCKIQGSRSYAVSQTAASQNFPRFSLLPRELQEMIWEFAAQEPRIVSVRVSNGRRNTGFRSLISTPPPILHTCSASRSIGLKHTTLSFASAPIYANNNMVGPFVQNSVLPPKVYFNPEIDTLWFGSTWNQGVDGKWCCLNRLYKLLDLDDLQQVKNVGFDLRAKTCSTRRNDDSYIHRPDFDTWTALEKVYLGLSRRPGACKGEIVLRSLGGEEEMEEFMSVYDEYWRRGSGPMRGVTGGEMGQIGCWYRTQEDESRLLISSPVQYEPVMLTTL